MAKKGFKRITTLLKHLGEVVPGSITDPILWQAWKQGVVTAIDGIYGIEGLDQSYKCNGLLSIMGC